MQKLVLIALGLGLVLGQGDAQGDGNQQPTQQDGQTQQDDQQQQDTNTQDDQTTDDTTTDQPSNTNTTAPVTDDDLAEIIANGLDEFADLPEEDKKEFIAQFQASDDITIQGFGFEGGEVNCTMTVPESSTYCPNYVGLPVTAEDDDFSAIITLIENTCASESSTAPSSLGPFLCLGAVGSCQASDLEWDLPQGNNKSNVEDFFNTVDFSKMTNFGEDNEKTTLCKKDCESAWKFWTECEAFALDKERDPCSGLPEEGCFDPDKPESTTLEGSSGSSALVISMVAFIGATLAWF